MKDKVVELLRDEFIGRNVEIVDSKNKDLIGIKGKIVDETKNMFEIESGKDTHPSDGAPFTGRNYKTEKDKISSVTPRFSRIEKKGTKKVQKKICKFKFLPEKIVVDGKIINYRPEDRISRKFKDW